MYDSPPRPTIPLRAVVLGCAIGLLLWLAGIALALALIHRPAPVAAAVLALAGAR